jgi:hypothetical protein
MANAPTLPSPALTQLITSMSGLVYGKLNRGRLYSRTVTRTFAGVGTGQVVLPDWPVTSVTSVQQGLIVIPASPPGTPGEYGYRYVPWTGDLPGDPSVIELIGSSFYTYPQNVQVTYAAGYMIEDEAVAVPLVTPFNVTVEQPMGIWSRNNGVKYAATGVALTPVATLTGPGQYIAPMDASPGTYIFNAADAGASLLVSYSFIPADLEEACVQMVAERYAYRGRIGEISKSLGGQETMRYWRGNSGPPWNRNSSLPPEVMDLLWPYVSVLPPAIGAPL